jgi:hypothetical protein
MTTLREAAQQALEALLDDPNKLVQISENHWESKRDLAVIALRAALAEPVGETTLDVSGATCFSATPAKWPVQEESR